MRLQIWREGPHYVLHDALAMPQPAAALFDPGHWRAQELLQGTAPGRGAVAFVRCGDQAWALRHYRRGGFVARISEDFYLWTGLERTRAWREFRLTARLHEAGLPVPRPIAAHVQSHGWRYRADLITERIAGAVPLADVLAEAQLPPGQWQEIGRMLRRFHDAGLRHDDINARNVLRDATQRFYLIDFDKAVTVPAGAWREKNLARFRRSLDKFRAGRPSFGFEGQDWTRLIEGYRSPSP